MRFVCLTILSMLLTAVASADPPADIANKELSQSSSIDEILDALDARGKDFKTFTANVTLAEESTDVGGKTTKWGKVWYQNQGEGNARIRVTFDTAERTEGKKFAEKIDYELMDGKLIERNYKAKSQQTNQVIRPGEKIDLFKLGQGPFPLPIGQPKEEVHKQFEVTKGEPSTGNDNPDPPGTVHIRLIPNPDTKLARKLKTIDAWVDVKSHMPVRIATRDHNETMDRTTDLTGVQINPDLSDANFDLGKLPDPNWNVTDQPYQD
jgi:outer membrane lipoprotein-sorting protein